jgi:hypothetical protein
VCAAPAGRQNDDQPGQGDEHGLATRADGLAQGAKGAFRLLGLRLRLRLQGGFRSGLCAPSAHLVDQIFQTRDGLVLLGFV